MAAALDGEGDAVIDLRAAPALAASEIGQCRCDIEFGQCQSGGLDRLGLGQHGFAERGEDGEFELQRPVGGGGDLGFELAELDRGEAHRIRHGLAMHEGRAPGITQEFLAGRLGHLDEIAEHRVVLDAQRPAAGLGRIARLQLGDDLARVDLEQAQLVERRIEAFAHEAAVATVEWQFIGQRRVEAHRQIGIALAKRPHGTGKLDRQFTAPDQQGRDRAGGIEPGAERREVARAATVERETRQGTGDIRHLLQGQAQVLAQACIRDEQLDRVMAGSDGGRISQRAGKALGQQARAARRHRAVDRGEQAALPLAAEGTGQLQIGAGRGVDQHRRRAGIAHRGRERRTGAELGALDIGERGAGRSDLGAREGAEGIERGDAEEFLQAPLGRGRVEPVTGQRRHGNRDLAPEFLELGIVMDRIRADDLARLQPRELDSEPLLRRLHHGEAACRDVDRRDAVERGRFAGLATRHRDEQAGAAGFEQALLGDGSGRDEAHDIALHHRLVAALLGLGRVLGLLADGDAMAGGDQALEIVIGTLDRHAAHRDVVALVLAALGQNDAERARGDLGIPEEQFVEIAHPVEQQAVRIGGLDLDVLRHHRRDALRRGGSRRRGAGGFGGGALAHCAGTLAKCPAKAIR